MDYQNIEHDILGNLQRRLDLEIPFPWESTMPRINDWKLHMKTRVRMGPIVNVDPTPFDGDARLEIWTDMEGRILPIQMQSLNTFKDRCVIISSLLPALLEESIRGHIRIESNRYPDLSVNLAEFRTQYPFPSGEFIHSATQITNVIWEDSVFIVLDFGCSWDNEHQPSALIYKDAVIRVEFDTWDADSIRRAAKKFFS
ncbi:MAG: hypothetical protein KDL09_21045 [Prosthecobacter sp.]|nr:hypothetical protein [Prosthecobacter sp.]